MARHDWIVRGRVRVEHGLVELRRNLGITSPLAGVLVRVSARERILDGWGPWAPWGKARSRADGSFSIEKRKDGSGRQFRVAVVFESDRLVLYGANDGLLGTALERFAPVTTLSGATRPLVEGILDHLSRLTYRSDRFEVWSDDVGTSRDPGSHDLGAVTLRRGLARRNGDTWCLCNRVFALLESYGPAFRFEKRVAIKYPHDNRRIQDHIETPYSSPENQVVYIVKNGRKDWYSTATLLHELMHVWAHGNCTREKGLVWQLLAHGGTHDERQDRTWTAFHEAFAEFCSHLLQRALLPRSGVPALHGDPGFPAEELPFSRSFLRDQGIRSTDDAQHYELGWISLFNMMVTEDLQDYDMNEPGTWPVRSYDETCRHRPLRFEELLRVVTGDPAQDVEPMRSREMNVAGFLDRAMRLFEHFGPAEKALYEDLLDPRQVINPRDELGLSVASSALARRRRPGPSAGRGRDRSGRWLVPIGTASDGTGRRLEA